MNDILAQFFLSGRVVDLAIAITVLEGLALAAYHRATGRGVDPRNFAVNMVSGLCLMLALRSALTGSSWMVVAVCLSASGAVHAFDIWRRWQR
jgi:hypothetical protein